MDADVREADTLRNGARTSVEAPLQAIHRFDPRTRLLLEGPIVGTLLRLATPTVLVMFVQAAVGLIETYFVASLATDALAGVALVFPPLRRPVQPTTGLRIHGRALYPCWLRL